MHDQAKSAKKKAKMDQIRKKKEAKMDQVRQWIARATDDQESMDALLLCFIKLTTTPLEFFKMLKAQYEKNKPKKYEYLGELDVSNEEFNRFSKNSRVQGKTCDILKRWVDQYWDQDFQKNKELQEKLTRFIEEVAESPDGKHTSLCLSNLVAKRSNKKEQDEDISKKGYKIQRIHEPSEDIAQQLTLMDFEIFKRISGRECLHSPNKEWDTNSPVMKKMIDHYNKITIWAQMFILRKKDRRFGRKGNQWKRIRKVIKIAAACRRLRSYNTCRALFDALEATPVHRLEAAWTRVNNETKTEFDELKKLFSTVKNCKNLRAAQKEALACLPAIPVLGEYTKCFTFFEEGNGNSERQLKNFHRLIKDFQRFQQSQWPFQLNAVLQKKLRNELGLYADNTEEDRYAESYIIKPRGY